MQAKRRPVCYKENGHVEKSLQFSRPISTLEVSYDNKEATCTMNADGSWLVILDGVTTDDIALSVIANGRLLPNVTLKVKVQGISKTMTCLVGWTYEKKNRML